MCAASVSAQGSQKRDFWFDFEDLPTDHIGYHVRTDQMHPFISSDIQSVNRSLADFFGAAGLPAHEAQGKAVGSATGSLLVAILPKLIGPTIKATRVASRWFSDRAARQRREQLPRVLVTILADHMEPVRMGKKVIDSARTICLLLPELQTHLEEAFPARRFHVKIRARAARIERAEIRLTGLPLSDSNTNRMLKLLDQNVPSLTIMLTTGWFGRPTVASARWVALPEISRLGRISGLGRTWGADSVP